MTVIDGYVPTSEEPPRDARPVISSATSVAEQCQDIAGADREHLVVFDLDQRRRVIQRRLVAIGSVNYVDAEPREVFKGAILASAVAIILAHNHPSGDPEPGAADVRATRVLQNAGEVLNIPVLDHVVVVRGGHVSMRECGALE